MGFVIPMMGMRRKTEPMEIVARHSGATLKWTFQPAIDRQDEQPAGQAVLRPVSGIS